MSDFRCGGCGNPMHIPQPGEGEWRCSCGVGSIGPMRTVYPNTCSFITFPTKRVNILHRAGSPIPPHLFEISFGHEHTGSTDPLDVVFNCDVMEIQEPDGSSELWIPAEHKWLRVASTTHLILAPQRIIRLKFGLAGRLEEAKPGLMFDTVGYTYTFTPLSKGEWRPQLPPTFNQWRPIETAAEAVRDGENVLVWGGRPDNYSCEITHDYETFEYSWREPRVVAARRYGERWYYCEYDSGVYGEYLNPTHWMPAPTPPTAKDRSNA